MNLVLIYILGFSFIFFMCRFFVANRARIIGIEAVHMFQQDVIRQGYYTYPRINYYKAMLYSLEEVVFLKPFSFSKYSAIKPEYFETLKSYADNVSV